MFIYLFIYYFVFRTTPSNIKGVVLVVHSGPFVMPGSKEIILIVLLSACSNLVFRAIEIGHR